MFKLFYPDEYADTVMNVDYAKLYSQGVRGLIFDIDNTLEGYEAAVPSGKTAAFLLSLVKMGFKVCFASNNNQERVEKFNHELAFPSMYKSGKPSKKTIARASELMDIDAKALAIIGDQIFTDVLCGRRSNIYTVLVKPVTSFDPWNVALKRLPEKLVLKSYMKSVKKSKKVEKNVGK